MLPRHVGWSVLAPPWQRPGSLGAKWSWVLGLVSTASIVWQSFQLLPDSLFSDISNTFTFYCDNFFADKQTICTHGNETLLLGVDCVYVEFKPSTLNSAFTSTRTLQCMRCANAKPSFTPNTVWLDSARKICSQVIRSTNRLAFRTTNSRCLYDSAYSIALEWTV